MQVTLIHGEIEDFKRQWPCNNIPELAYITFEYDKCGNLVDIWAYEEGGKYIDSSAFDGPALLALSQDAQKQIREDF